MPLYEYECTVCGERTELIQRMADPLLSECPKCGKPVRKLLSAPSFQFKGSGWYVTDYAGKGSEKAKGSESSEKKEKKEEKEKKETKVTAASTETSESKKGSGGKSDA